MVREGAGERAQYHVIDGWQHLATLDGDACDAEEIQRASTRQRPHFDMDSYRILTRLLNEPKYRPQPLPR